MVCSHVYGDVLARGAIQTSTGLICDGDRQQVTGGLSSQTGESLLIGNKIHAASKYVIAKPEHSNFDGGQEVPADAGDQLATESVTVKWARSK